jgi:glycine oxidase
MAEKRHIAIAGAGVVGLACALELRRRGLTVTVFEAGHAMREASWAAGGMLAVEDPENPVALRPLSLLSRSLYEPFLAEIARLSGLTIPLRTHHTLQAVSSAHPASSRAATLLRRQQAEALAPGIADWEAGGSRYLLLEEASLDPRDLCAALPAAARAAGVQLREQEPVLSVTAEGEGVRIASSHALLQADGFLDCCGAWAGGLAGPGQPEERAIVPRKGQMMVVAAPAGAPPLTCVLRSPEIYLIPRDRIPPGDISGGEGRIAIGATIEDAGFSKTTDDASLALLRRRAASLWPTAADARLLECWAGLRPATADGLPLLGEAASPRCWIASGHYRNGILLAPGTALCLGALIAGERPPLDLSAFAPGRMPSPAACDNDFAAAL